MRIPRGFSLEKEECLLGRGDWCDIIIDLPTVSKEHAKIFVKIEDGSVYITALSETNPSMAKVSGVPIDINVPVKLRRYDVFSIGDRSFRWQGNPLPSCSVREFPSESPKSDLTAAL